MNDSRTLVLFHGRCTYGFAAAWVAHRVLGAGAEYAPVEHDGPMPDVSDREVLLLDMSYRRETMLDLRGSASSITLLDHHKTALDVADLPGCTVDLERSGAGLAWDVLCGGPRPWLIDYVEDRDLWRHRLPETRAVNACLGAMEHSFAAWDALKAQGRDAAAERGRPIVAETERVVAEMVRGARRISFEGYRVPFVEASPFHRSELIGRLAEGEPFAMGCHQRDDGLFSYSLRSRGRTGVDVAAIAQRYGGGGHAGAASFRSHARVA